MPYGLYRTSALLQRCTLPLPISLLPLCAVQPVQNLSVFTTVHFNFTYTSIPLRAVRLVQNLSAYATVHFTFTYTSNPPRCRTACTESQCLYNGALYLYLYLYSPYVLHGLYRPSVSVQRCTLTLPIPQIPLCAVRPVQSGSASTTVNFNFTYTSTPPMSRTACTDPQCLYNGAIYLYLYL